MYWPYAFQPYAAPPDLTRALPPIRLFLNGDQPHLHAAVYHANRTLAFGGMAPDPAEMVKDALQQAPNHGVDLCSLLASPLGQIGLDTLGILEFPGMGYRLLFQLLPPAAQAVCAERKRNDAALGLGVLGFGLLILRALSSNPKQPPLAP
jgi:hypothetical protein